MVMSFQRGSPDNAAAMQTVPPNLREPAWRDARFMIGTGKERDLMIRTYMTLALTFLALAACETVEGAGRDMTAAGTAITQEAQGAKY
jgi:predicted small secreted protein